MNKMNWKWTLVFAALVAVTVLLNAQAWAGKPPVTPPPPPPPKPLPNVQYNIQWLDVLGGADAINDSGCVVGTDRATPGAVQTAFLYTPESGVLDFGTLVDPSDPNYGFRITGARGINSSGQVVGNFTRNGVSIAYRFTPGFYNSVGIWVASVVDEIPLPPGTDYFYPCGINDYSDVVGETVTTGGPSKVFVYNRNSQWINTTTITSGGSEGSINNSTQVAGQYYHDATLFSDRWIRSFRWSPSEALTLFGNINNYATGINDAGQFVGCASFVYWGHAFRYTDGKGMVNLGTLGTEDLSESMALGINNLGQVVGTSSILVKVKGVFRRTHTYGFLYTDDSGMVNLDKLVGGSTADLNKWTSAAVIYTKRINTPRLPNGELDLAGFGQICGTASFNDSAGNYVSSEGFLLTPQFKQR